MAYDVTLIPGDGIGPEVASCTRRIVESSGVKISWDIAEAGADVADATGTPVPDSVLTSIRKNNIALKGPIGTPIGKGFRSVNVTLRKALRLYACLRPVKSLPGIETRYDDIDLIIVRENTEGEYSGLEHLVIDGVAESLKVITEAASLRIANYAFKIATDLDRKRVTAVHKANIMKVTDGLFLSCVNRAATHFPEIEHDTVIVDNCAMQLVRDPNQFDVMVMTNLYGDILSDLCSGLVGGLGVVPSANIGEDCAVFEAVHGSAPDIAGKGIANPTALTMSATMMLRHMGESAAGDAIEQAIFKVFEKGEQLTRDLGGQASSKEFTDAVIAEIG